MKPPRCFFYCYCWVDCEHSWVLDWEWGHLVLWVLVAVLLFSVWRSWCNFGALGWMFWSARRVEEGAVWVWLFFIMFNQSLFQWLLILKWGILEVCEYDVFILKFSHFLKHFCLSYSSLCYYHFQLLPKIGSLLQDVMSLMRAVYLEQSRRIIKSDRYQRWKLAPQPHLPFSLGLLKTN